MRDAVICHSQLAVSRHGQKSGFTPVPLTLIWPSLRFDLPPVSLFQQAVAVHILMIQVW